MGSPALATDRVEASRGHRGHRRGPAPRPSRASGHCPSRFEKSCAMRTGSQSTGWSSAKRGLDRAAGRGRLQLGDDLPQHRLAAPRRAALRSMPPPSRPRAKSRTLSISADMRAMLPCMSRTISAASSVEPAALQQVQRRHRSRRADCAGRGRAPR